VLTKNKRLFRFDSCLTLQNSFFFSFDIVFLLYRFRFFSLYFVFLLYRFRLISFDFVFLLYRFRWILFSFRFVSFLFVSQFTGTLPSRTTPYKNCHSRLFTSYNQLYAESNTISAFIKLCLTI